jgi:hypothetical protein
LLAIPARRRRWCRRSITVDDSGAPHQGQKGYVTVVSGPTFAWFGNADNQSHMRFLTHRHDGQPSYGL